MNTDDTIEETDSTENNLPIEPQEEEEISTSSNTNAIVDMVINGSASEAKDAIFASLYQKVGHRIDALRPEIRNTINADRLAKSDQE